MKYDLSWGTKPNEEYLSAIGFTGNVIKIYSMHSKYLLETEL